MPNRSLSKSARHDKELVGGFNPFKKYARQIGSFPQLGMNIPKKSLKPPDRICHDFSFFETIGSFPQVGRGENNKMFDSPPPRESLKYPNSSL